MIVDDLDGKIGPFHSHHLPSYIGGPGNCFAFSIFSRKFPIFGDIKQCFIDVQTTDMLIYGSSNETKRLILVFDNGMVG